MATKTVRCEEMYLRDARNTLIQKTRPLWGQKTETRFEHVFGVALHKVPDSLIVNLALAALVERVEKEPEGKTGLSCFDEPSMAEPWTGSRTDQNDDA